MIRSTEIKEKSLRVKTSEIDRLNGRILDALEKLLGRFEGRHIRPHKGVN